MNGFLRRKVVITNPQGLHMRPITAFVEEAAKYQSDVLVGREQQESFNGKSALSLLGLAAEQGTELILEVSGPDADQAMEALVMVLNRVFTEEASPEKKAGEPPER